MGGQSVKARNFLIKISPYPILYSEWNREIFFIAQNSGCWKDPVLLIQPVNCLEILVGINFHNIVKRTGTDCYFIVVAEIFQSYLIPVTLFSAGHVVHAFDIIC